MYYYRLMCQVFLVILFPFVLQAQQEPVDLEMVQRIKHEGLRNSSIRDISFHLTDVIGPRLSGSTNLARANEWTSQQMKEWGLENVEIAPWGEFGPGWENTKFYAAMTEPYYQSLIGVPRAWTRGTDGLISGSPVLVDVQSEEDFDEYRGQLQGKVVVTPVTSEPSLSFNPLASRYSDEDLERLAQLPEVSGPDYGNVRGGGRSEWAERRAFNEKLNEFYEEEGVAAVLRPSGTFGAVRSGGSRLSEGQEPAIAQVDMTFEHYARIVRLLEADIDVSIDLEVENRILEDDMKGYNVLAEIPGTDRQLRDEVVLIGGHLDSWHVGTGANDNAAGVAIMMEVMRILKELEVEPRRTIRIGLWGAEEQGLFGSRGYISEHYYDQETGKKDDFDKLSAYFNIDNGSGRLRGIWLMGNDEAKPIFEDLLEPFHDMGATTATLRSTGSTDHVAFDRAGLPGFNMLQDRLDYGRGYHTNMDTFERMELGDMMQAAVVMASIVYHVAQRDERIPRKVFNP